MELEVFAMVEVVHLPLSWSLCEAVLVSIRRYDNVAESHGSVVTCLSSFSTF